MHWYKPSAIRGENIVFSNHMKIYLKILVLFLFKFNIVSAQEDEWKKIRNSFSQKVIKENSSESLKDNDSLNLEIYRFKKNEKIDLTDLTKLQLIPTKISFENFKFTISRNNFNPQLKKNSEYQIRYETPENANYKYNMYLTDDITKNEIKDLIEYLKKNFKINKIEFISKEEAMKQASEILGVNYKDLFEGDLFPASIEIESKTKINSKHIEKKYPKLITDIINDDSDLGIAIMIIKT